MTQLNDPRAYALKIVAGLDAARRASSMHRPVDEAGLIEAAISDAMSHNAKTLSYLEQENSVLHAKLRQLEISLSSEREACAKIAEDYGKARYAYETEGGRSKQDAFTAANSIAQLIRGRGET